MRIWREDNMKHISGLALGLVLAAGAAKATARSERR